jgi:hypothetical protein
VAALGASLVGGPDGHRGPVMEITLVVWGPLAVPGLHGGGSEGVESVDGGEFLSSMFIVGGGLVVGCRKPRRWLSSFFF